MKLVQAFIALLGFALPLYAGVAMTEVSHGEDWDLAMPMNGISFQRAKAVSPATIDRPSLRFSRLKNLNGVGKTRKQSLTSVLDRSGHSKFTKDGSFQNTTAIGPFSTQYGIQCAWDGKLVWLIFDTGSSDTWAAKDDFRCADTAGLGYPQEHCKFGHPLVEDFAHGEIEGMHFYLQYGSGEEVSGPMGRSDISCGGLLVTEQQVGLANNTYWRGNNVTVGILGLAYPALTSAYYGEIGEESEWNAIPYSPFFTNAVAQGTIDPVFSVAIVKNSSDGLLAWGGLPPVPYYEEQVARTDLIIANLINQAETAWQYSFYTIIPDGVIWGRTMDVTKYPYIVDTGTTMMFLPPPLVEAIAMSFQPRAVYLYQWGKYFAPCDAIAPRFAIVIGGVKLWINAADMIYQGLTDSLTGYCAIAVASGGEGPYVLGDAFLQSVVAAFDVGAAEMRFYQRK